MNYEETLKDIENTLGVIPAFMKTLPRDFLIREWPLFKIYNFEKKKILSKYKERISLATSASIRCPYCILFNVGLNHVNDATDDGFEEVKFLANYVDRGSAIFSIQHNGHNEFKKKPDKTREYLQKMMQN